MAISDNGHQAVGRPDAQVEAGYLYFKYCGGAGGGGCLQPLGTTSIALAYRIPRFVVRNRRIIFENKEFFGVRIFTDAGPDGFGCLHSLGIVQPFWMALSADGNLTDAQIVARGQQFPSDPLPYQIVFLEEEIPQPKEALWSGFIFLHIYWGNTAFLNENGTIEDTDLRIIKHDYDQQL